MTSLMAKKKKKIGMVIEREYWKRMQNKEKNRGKRSNTIMGKFRHPMDV